MSTLYYCHVFIVFYIILTLPFNTNGTSFIPLSHYSYQREIARNLTEAIVGIVQNFFIDKYHIKGFTIQIKVKNTKNLYFFHEIVDGTFDLLHDRIGITLGSGIPIPVSKEMHFSILLVDSLQSLEYLYANIIKYHLYINGSYFIVLHTLPYPSHYYDDLYGILKVNWQAGISHANVLIYAVNNVVLLYHDVPFNEFHCNVNAPVINNHFKNGRWQHTNFYVSKANDLHGCPLICATWEDMPYFKIGSKSTKNSQIFVGLEGRMLEYLAERMNFTVVIRWMTDEEINQTIYDEQGILNQLFETGTDFAIGAFHDKSTSLEDPFTPTTAYYLSTYYFIVSSKADPYEPFTKLLLPFTGEIWYVLIFIFIGGNCIIYILTQLDRKWKSLILGRRKQKPIYNMVVITLGGSITNDPVAPFSRFLLMVWLLATFVLRTVYQGVMYHFIKNDLHKPPPKTIQELRSGYSFLMTEVVYNYVQHIDWLQKNAIVFNGSEAESFDMLRDPNVYGMEKKAVLTTHEYFGFYKLFNYGNFDFYMVPQVLFTQQLCIYMKKNSVLLNRFNMYIKHYIDEGLMNRWERFLIYGEGHRKSKDETARPMKILHLYGPLNLLTGCLCLSFGVFLVELGWVFCFRPARSFWRKACKRRSRKRVVIEFTK